MAKVGLVAGDLSPLHRGHIYVLDFARHFADRVKVVIVSQDSTDLLLERVELFKKLMPDCEVLPYSGYIEELGHSIKLGQDHTIDYVFGFSESSQILADELSATYIPVSPEHSVMSPDAAAFMDSQSVFSKQESLTRVCIFGPESTGKSTLSKRLANHFKTLYVPEWARTLISHKNDQLFQEDLPIFAKGQCAAEDALARQATGLLVCDTDPLITAIWSEWLYGHCDPVVYELVEKRTYDLYLLTDVDVPWVAESQRYLPEGRREFFEKCRFELEKRDRPYVVIRGSFEERFQTAVTAVSEVLAVSRAAKR